MEEEYIEESKFKQISSTMVEFLKNNWGKIIFLGIIITIYSVTGIPGFGLFKQVFGWVDAVVSGLQSVFTGVPGNCINKKPICGKDKEFSGISCCPCANNDEKKGNMSCDNDDTVCCGCGNGCPIGKSLIEKLSRSKNVLAIVGIVTGGAILLALIGAFGRGKFLTGRTPAQSASIYATAANAEAFVDRGVLTPDAAGRVVLVKEISTKENLSVEQKKVIVSQEKAMADLEESKQKTLDLERRASSDPGNRPLKEQAIAAKEDEIRRAAEVDAENKKVIDSSGPKIGKR
jgi:hypothetical protein